MLKDSKSVNIYNLASTVGYLFWAVGMRNYHIELARNGSMVPSILAASIFAIIIGARNYKWYKKEHKFFPPKFILLEVVFCFSTFVIGYIAMPNGLNIFLLDIVSIAGILFLRYVYKKYFM